MYNVLSFIKRVTLIVSTCTFGLVLNAHAVFIDFDDLVPIYDPESPCFCDNPLTNQYASKGLLVDNAYFNGESFDGGLTYENVLTSGPYTQLNFTGPLPTFVSMYITSANNDAIFLTAYGLKGFISEVQTPGYAGSDEDPAAVPNFLVSFSSAAGIKSINIDSYYFLRVGAAIDDLTFTYSSVPEPSSLILLILGLMAVTLRRLK